MHMIILNSLAVPTALLLRVATGPEVIVINEYAFG